MDRVDELPAWPALVTKAYLSELACNESTQGGGLFFWQILELSGWTPGRRMRDIAGERAVDKEQRLARTIEGYTRAYVQLVRDGSLALAEELATSASARAELGVTDDATLLAVIAATLYLKPNDPVSGELCKRLPMQVQGKIEGVRTNILRRLRYLLMNRPTLAVLATARLRGKTGADQFGYGSERIGVAGYSHFARESLLFVLLSLLSGAPEQFFAAVRDALDELTTGPGDVLGALNTQQAIAASGLSRLVRGVIQPTRTDLAKWKGRAETASAASGDTERSRSHDAKETHRAEAVASVANDPGGFGFDMEAAIDPGSEPEETAVGSSVEDGDALDAHEGDEASVASEVSREEQTAVGRIWNVANPAAPPRVLRGHDGGTRAFAVDPRGRWLAAITDKWEVGLWDLASKRLAWRWLTHKGPVRALAIDPSGHWLAGRERGPSVQLWRLDDPESPAISLGGKRGLVTSLAFDANGETLAAGNIQGLIRLWSLAGLRTGASKPKPRELSPPEPPAESDEPDNEGILAVALDQNSDRLASGWLSGLVHIWELSPTAVDEPLVFDTGRGAVLTLAFDPQRRWLAVGGEDGKVCLLDPARPETSPIPLSGCAGSIRAIAFDASGQRLTAIAEHGIPCQWDCSTTAARRLCAPDGIRSVQSTAFAPQARWLAAGGDAGKISLWDLTHPEAPPRSLRGGEALVLALAFDMNGTQLAAGYGDVSDGPSTVRKGSRWEQQPMAPTPLEISKKRKALQDKRKGILSALKPLRAADLRRPLRNEPTPPTKVNLSARDELERQLNQLDQQIAGLWAQEQKARKSPPVEKDTVARYRPILDAVLRSLESSKMELDIRGRSVKARDYFRLRFAAQWISALTGRDYTHGSRDQILTDLQEVCSPSDDPLTGNALLAFSALVGATENEVWGRAHDAALKTIITASLQAFSAPPAEEMIRDLRSKVRRALDDCFDTDVEEVVAQSPAMVDLADPMTLLEIYRRSLYLKSLYSKAVRPDSLGPRAAIQRLLRAVQALARAAAGQVLPRLSEVLPTVQGLDELDATSVTALRNTATALKTARTRIRMHVDRDKILTNESIRREYFLLQATIDIVEGEETRLKQVEERTSDIDPRKVKRFFTQTFSTWAGENDAKNENDDQEKPTWPVKDWTLLARGLCRDEVSFDNARLYERVRLRFESRDEADLRTVFRDLTAQTIDKVPFVAAFTGAVDSCLHP